MLTAISPRALVHADDALVVDVLVTALRAQGYRVVPCRDLLDLWAAAVDADVAVVEFWPGRRSSTAQQHRRMLGLLGATLPLVLLVDEPTTLDTAGLVFEALLPKPFDLDEMLRTVERARARATHSLVV